MSVSTFKLFSSIIFGNIYADFREKTLFKIDRVKFQKKFVL